MPGSSPDVILTDVIQVNKHEQTRSAYVSMSAYEMHWNGLDQGHVQKHRDAKMV